MLSPTLGLESVDASPTLVVESMDSSTDYRCRVVGCIIPTVHRVNSYCLFWNLSSLIMVARFELNLKLAHSVKLELSLEDLHRTSKITMSFLNFYIFSHVLVSIYKIIINISSKLHQKWGFISI